MTLAKVGAVALLTVASLAPLQGCVETGSDGEARGLVGDPLTVSIDHESGCPVEITAAEVAVSDTMMTCHASVRSGTRSAIQALVLRCSLKDTSGQLGRPVGPPVELVWTGLLPPGETVAMTLSGVISAPAPSSSQVAPSALLAELEPQEVTFADGRDWTRIGPIAQ